MPFVPRNAAEHFAFKRMEDAASLVSAIEQVRAKEADVSFIAYERFYNNLALFSGGTVALSVTYLGHLKTLSKPVACPRLLISSWIALIICLTCSVFWTMFHTHYGHFFRDREYNEALKTKFETEAAEIVHLDIVNVRTPEERQAYVGQREEAALIVAAKARRSKFWEKLFLNVWQPLGWIARLGFLLGLVLLLIFAAKNF